jgi:phosphatidylglycerophosphate synthase
MNHEAEMSNAPEIKDRRPLKTRSWPIFQKIAAGLATAGVSPNSISVASVFFAVLGAVGFLITGWTTDNILMRCGWLLAIVGIQLRLIANLLDGMVAVEGGKASAVGPLYNEVPDRISDPILLIAAGYAYSGSAMAGWAAAVLALLVAYTRAIGASVGAGQLFLGPMAKQQRMALLTLVAALALVLPSSWLQIMEVSGRAIGLLEIALWIMVVGCVMTVIRRLHAVAVYLNTHGKNHS